MQNDANMTGVYQWQMLHGIHTSPMGKEISGSFVGFVKFRDDFWIKLTFQCSPMGFANVAESCRIFGVLACPGRAQTWGKQHLQLYTRNTFLISKTFYFSFESNTWMYLE